MAYTTIDKPSDYFNTVLYTGNGSTQSITGVGFQPDWIWTKGRAARGHTLVDVIRGATKTLETATTTGEETQSSSITSIDSDGFSLGSRNQGNANGEAFVSWNWLASNSTASNEDGSITSTVSANTTSGFSIVSYTGTGANATVGHGLNATPKMIIMKNLQLTTQWQIYHESIGNTHHLQFDTSAKLDDAGAFNDTSPTSSVFSLGASNYGNGNGNNMIAYCFADTGNKFFKAGSYTGNGNASGPYIYTGHKPAAIIIKRTDVAKNWYINDNLREGYNNDNPYISPNLSVAETGGTEIDILSNGFRITASGTGHNQSGGTYIYASIAANPFVTSSGVPACAR